MTWGFVFSSSFVRLDSKTLTMKSRGLGGPWGDRAEKCRGNSRLLTPRQNMRPCQSGPHGDAPARAGLAEPRRPGNVPEVEDAAACHPVPVCAAAGQQSYLSAIAGAAECLTSAKVVEDQRCDDGRPYRVRVMTGCFSACRRIASRSGFWVAVTGSSTGCSDFSGSRRSVSSRVA